MRWGEELARIEARVGRAGHAARGSRHASRWRSCGPAPAARASGSGSTASPAARPALAGVLRTVLFAPEEMLLVAGSPSLRREALDRLAGQRSPAYVRELATYGRALQQRNGLLRRDPRGAGDAGRAPVLGRRRSSSRGRPSARSASGCCAPSPGRSAAAHARDRPGRGGGRAAGPRLRDQRAAAPRRVRRGTRWPGAWPRPPRRRRGTAPRSSGRTATTSCSRWAAGRWPRSRREASSGRRSSRSSSPSWTS